MKVKSITYKRTICPQGGSGTGCSEPDVYTLELNNGKKVDVYIDIWYQAPSRIANIFYNSVVWGLGFTPDNMDELFKQYVKQVAEHTSLTELEILNASKPFS